MLYYTFFWKYPVWVPWAHKKLLTKCLGLSVCKGGEKTNWPISTEFPTNMNSHYEYLFAGLFDAGKEFLKTVLVLGQILSKIG